MHWIRMNIYFSLCFYACKVSIYPCIQTEDIGPYRKTAMPLYEISFWPNNLTPQSTTKKFSLEIQFYSPVTWNTDQIRLKSMLRLYKRHCHFCRKNDCYENLHNIKTTRPFASDFWSIGEVNSWLVCQRQN